MAFEPQVDYKTVLDNFEGPLDLLLYLVREAKIDIKDIFVSQVTEQYLAYINSMAEFDVEIASDYLVIAAILVEKKAKMLLPPEDDEFAEEDEGDRLVKRMEEYKLLKTTFEPLKSIENVNRFYKAPDKSVGEVKVVYSDLFDLDGLVSAFKKLMMRFDDKKRAEIDYKEIPKEVFTVKDKIEYIRSVLLEKTSMSFFELFRHAYSRSELITTFQAMLELLKLQYISATQNGIFDDITITLREDRNEELGQIDDYS